MNSSLLLLSVVAAVLSLTTGCAVNNPSPACVDGYTAPFSVITTDTVAPVAGVDASGNPTQTITLDVASSTFDGVFAQVYVNGTVQPTNTYKGAFVGPSRFAPRTVTTAEHDACQGHTANEVYTVNVGIVTAPETPAWPMNHTLAMGSQVTLRVDTCTAHGCIRGEDKTVVVVAQ